jgi:hypothetical protein
MAEDFGDFGDETLLNRDEYLLEVAEQEQRDYMRELANQTNDELVKEQDAIDAQLDRMTGGNDEDGQMSDVEADADVFRSCGWGTDEDYGG